jgi:hypothetical protein
MSNLTKTQTYVLAHTAQCKLQIAADRPDRNLRFLLGHATALDNLMLRIVEIEEQSAAEQLRNERSANPAAPRRVSFVDNSARPTGLFQGSNEESAPRRKGSPPPSGHVPDGSDDDDDDEYDEDEEDDGLGLTRYGSGAAQPPRFARGGDSDSEEEDHDEPRSPPSMPSEAELRQIMGGEDDEELAGLYESVRTCGCQDGNHEGHEGAPVIESIWEVPSPESGKQSGEMRRTAVIQIRT